MAGSLRRHGAWGFQTRGEWGRDGDDFDCLYSTEFQSDPLSKLIEANRHHKATVRGVWYLARVGIERDEYVSRSTWAVAF